MKTRRALVAVCLASFLASGAVVAQTSRPASDSATRYDIAGSRPNIVVILADDLGYSDLSSFGSEIPTPNIDSIARGGVTFTSFYNQARCCPTRAALMSGRYPHQVGVGAMIDGYATWQRDAAADPAHYGDHLAKNVPTMPELLREAGYRTLMSGKWHLGYREDESPSQRGFERSFALIGGAMNYYGGRSDGPGTDKLALDGQPFTPPRDGFYATDVFTDRAVEFVNEAKASSPDKPFFLYLTYNAPHWPLHADEADIAKFKGQYDAGWQPIREKRLERLKQLGLVPADQKMAPMDYGLAKPWDELNNRGREEWARRMEVYAAQVAKMDDGVGRVLEALAKNDLEKNTIVIFLSDNGGAAEDPNRGNKREPIGGRDTFRGYGRPWATVSNTPFRYHKISAYEGGISTPMLVRMPGSAGRADASRSSTRVGTPGAVYDLLPTFLELAGAKGPDNLEGRSLLPQFRGEADAAERVFCWEHEGNRGVRKGKWKLVALPDKSEDEWELYDLDADRIEQNNVAGQHAAIVADLKAEYARWAERSGVIAWRTLQDRRDAATQPTAAK